MATILDDASSFLSGANAAFIEQLYAQYLDDPNSVDESWRAYFERVAAQVAAAPAGAAVKKAAAPERVPPPAETPMVGPVADSRTAPRAAQDNGDTSAAAQADQAVSPATIESIRALMMIRAFRVRGHLIANLDPLGIDGEKHHPELDPRSYGFTEADFDRPIYVDGVLGLNWATLRDVLGVLKQTYCARIGVEFMHIQHPDRKSWIQHQVEGSRNRASLTRGEKCAILQQLDEAEGFERFLDIKYRGAKRFSLEGSESVIPALEAIIERAADLGVDEVVMGMAHRGRLNVLTSIMGKSYAAVFSEFQGGVADAGDVQGSGDVKYHLGASADRALPKGKMMHISLTPNPSHLEAVNPVVLGKVRAKQAARGDGARERVMGVLVHGDAAFAGQGLCAETLELSDLRGYRTGGTIHIIINNQIGFTTSPSYARSSPYPSDVAKIIQTPIFHVNGDDPEAVVHVCRLAVEYRQRFQKDIVVDIFCYRRHGHNEGDEPAFTQPAMYQAIPLDADHAPDLHRAPRVGGRALGQRCRPHDRGFPQAPGGRAQGLAKLPAEQGGLVGGRMARHGGSGPSIIVRAIPRSTARPLVEIGRAITQVPGGFAVHRRIKRQLDEKRSLVEAGGPIDWANRRSARLRLPTRRGLAGAAFGPGLLARYVFAAGTPRSSIRKRRSGSFRSTTFAPARRASR